MEQDAARSGRLVFNNKDLLQLVFQTMDVGSIASAAITSKEFYDAFLQFVKVDIEKWRTFLESTSWKNRQVASLQLSTPIMSLLLSRWNMVFDKVYHFTASLKSADITYYYLFYLKKAQKVQSELNIHEAYIAEGYFPAQNGFSIIKPVLSFHSVPSNPFCFIGIIDWRGSGRFFVKLEVKFLDNFHHVLEGEFWQHAYTPTEPYDGTICGEVYGEPFRSDDHHHHHTHTHPHEDHDDATHHNDDRTHTHAEFHNFPTFDQLRKWKSKKKKKRAPLVGPTINRQEQEPAVSIHAFRTYCGIQ